MSEIYELSSSCVCEEDCGGVQCWTIAKEDIDIVMTDWFHTQTKFQDNYLVKFFSKNMNWDRVSGYTYAEIDDGLQPLYINGDFRLVVTRDGDNLTVVRYSHDEPVGASFVLTVEPQPEGD